LITALINAGVNQMPKQSITDAFVRNLTWGRALGAFLKGKDRGDRPPPKQVAYIHTIERGLALVLVLSSGGTKAWRVLTYENGKAVSRKLGTYPALSVKAARDKAREAFENPTKFEAEAKVGTFKDVAEKWFRHHVERNELRSAKELKRHLDNYILPKWASLQFHEIGRRKVTELLDEIADTRGPASADAILATVRSIMSWQEARDDHYRSPIARKMKRKKATARDRVLGHDEIRAVWKAADQCEVFGSFIKVLLLTAQRRDKVATMKHDDIKDGVWVIPCEPREKGNAGTIKLPQTVIDIIEAQPKIANNPFVFAGRHGKALNHFSQGKAELDKLTPDVSPWRLHDLRRTARTLMSDAGVRPDIAERVLGHAIPGVGGVYDRSQYFEQKSEALAALAKYVQAIVDPPSDNNVVELRR
jgi:integrase